jgi:carboxypeptidase family protein
VATISGAATDIQGVAVPNVCVGVFTETDHKFIAAAQTDDSGRFELKNVPDGNYRLVAKYEVLALATRIHVNRHSRSKKPLASHIRLAGIDTTSYFESKERYDYFPVRQ